MSLISCSLAAKQLKNNIKSLFTLFIAYIVSISLQGILVCVEMQVSKDGYFLGSVYLYSWVVNIPSQNFIRWYFSVNSQ